MLWNKPHLFLYPVLLRAWIISATMLTAIYSGVSAPMSKPIGA